MIEKVSGQNFFATCETGTMSVGACAADKSRFISIQGHMDLKNVQNNSEVHLPDGGSLTMTGVDGRLIAKTLSGRVYIQFNRLTGNSIVDIQNKEHATIKLSPNVDKEASIVAIAKLLTLDDDLVSLKEKVSKSGFLTSRIETADAPALIITTGGSLHIGKETCLDSVKLQTKCVNGIIKKK